MILLTYLSTFHFTFSLHHESQAAIKDPFQIIIYDSYVQQSPFIVSYNLYR